MNWNITAGRPVYVQLVEQLELALVAGEFPPGNRIPPVRELAADAGVNPNTCLLYTSRGRPNRAEPPPCCVSQHRGCC